MFKNGNSFDGLFIVFKGPVRPRTGPCLNALDIPVLGKAVLCAGMGLHAQLYFDF